jgi:hypothetical protein
VAFAQNRPKVALDYFSRAITANPSCDASVRTAVACCCFKSEQYDRAEGALVAATNMHVSVHDTLSCSA